MSATTTLPMPGPSDGGSSAIRRPAPPNSSSCPSGSSISPHRRSSSCTRIHTQSRCSSPGSPTTRCSAMAFRPNGSPRSGEPTRTPCSTSPNACRRRLPRRCLNLATGTTPAMPERAPIEADPFAHPDAQRRFRVLTNVEELERALDFPWEKWAVFLHPAQRRAGRARLQRPGPRLRLGRAPARRSWRCTARLPWRGDTRRRTCC